MINEATPKPRQQDDEDRRLLHRLKADPMAFERLYRAFYPRLFEFVLRMLGSPADAEEAINDTMLVVWNKADEFAGRSKVSTWIFGIAYKKSLKRLKVRKRLNEREINMDVELHDTRDLADTLSDREMLERVRTAVGKLPIAQRSIVHLAFFYGYSYPEIAQIVDCPVNTVKTRMFYARERLRPLLDQAAQGEEDRHGHR